MASALDAPLIANTPPKQSDILRTAAEIITNICVLVAPSDDIRNSWVSVYDLAKRKTCFGNAKIPVSLHDK